MRMQDIMLDLPVNLHKQNVQQELTKHLLDNLPVLMLLQDIMFQQPVKHHKQNVQKEHINQILVKLLVEMQMQDITLMLLDHQVKPHVQ